MPVNLWKSTGTRAEFDRLLDSGMRARAGDGRWTRTCPSCGSDQHGRRVFHARMGASIPVSVSHAGRRHVAVTAWGALRIGVDIEADAMDVAPPAPTPDGPRALLARWVAHEARSKALDLPLAAQPAEVPLLLRATPEAVSAHDLWWQRWDVDGHTCVLAADAPFAVHRSRMPAGVAAGAR